MNKTRYGCRKPDHEVFKLKDKIFCGNCHKKMYPVSAISSNGQPLRYYNCTTRKNQGCHTKKIDKDFIESIIDKLNSETNTKISILCRGRNKNAEEIEKILVENQIDYFYGMFNEEDEDYVDFHNKCQNMFFDKFSINQVISNKALERFVQSVKCVYSTSSNKTIKSLLLLLDALKQKVIQDYTTLTYEEKYELIMDIFENRQLKQSMEYIESRVIITTVHSAKGLEWDYVYIPDLERWMFPSWALCGECENKFSTMVNCRCQLFDFHSSTLEKNFLEELSVFYVAITRARKNVIVSASSNRLNNNGDVKNSGFSCFANLKGIRLVQE